MTEGKWLVQIGTAPRREVPNLAAIEAMARSGELLPESYVWEPVSKQWITASEMPNLAAIFNAKKERSGYARVGMQLGCLGLLVGTLGVCAAPMTGNASCGGAVGLIGIVVGILIFIVGVGFSAMYHLKK